MRRLAWVGLLLVAAQSAVAAPRESVVPAARPEAAAPAPADAAGSPAQPGAPDATAAAPEAAPPGLAPAPRPADLAPPEEPPAPPALEAAPAEAARVVEAGPVCGASDIIGVRIAEIPGRIAQCGVARPVKIVSVAGLNLSQEAVVDCVTARALKTWIEQGVRPAIRRIGGGPEGLRVAAHYSCRTRNNQPGAKVSKHGLGRAIDISGIRLASGQVLSVEHGWRDERFGPRLRAMHRAACGPFTTVLGPNADRFHRDHFHFDTTRGRGPYCR